MPSSVTLRRGPRSGRFELAGGVVLPVAGQEFGEAILRGVGDALEDVGEPGLRVDVVELGGADEAVDDSGPLGAAI